MCSLQDVWSLISSENPPAAGYLKVPHGFASNAHGSSEFRGDLYVYRLSTNGLLATGQFVKTSPDHGNEAMCSDVYWTSIEARRELNAYFKALRTNDVVTAPYVISELKDSADRQRAGLPTSGLQTSNRLKSIREPLSGFSTVWDYRSYGRSVTFLHLEDWRIQSANALHRGYPKVWIIIPARETDSLEARLGEFLGLKYTCGQFIRHQNLFLSPSQLEEWNISYSLEVQNPGEMILTDHGVYHQVYNGGPNRAEAVNGCGRHWIPPFTYKHCLQRCFTKKTDIPITREMLQIHLSEDTSSSESEAASSSGSEDLESSDSTSVTDGSSERTLSSNSRRPRKPNPQSQRSSHKGFLSASIHKPRTSLRPKKKPKLDDSLDRTDYPATDKDTAMQDLPMNHMPQPTSTTGVSQEGQPPIPDEPVTIDSSQRLEDMVAEALELREHILPEQSAEKQHEILKRYLISHTSESWLHEDTVNLTLRILCSAFDDYAFWPSTVFLSNQLDWVHDLTPSEAHYILCARCENNHWELVRIDTVAKTATLYGAACQSFPSWVKKIGRLLDERTHWAVMYQLPTIKQLNSIDCGFIVFADAEMILDPASSQSIQPTTLRLRERYLEVLLAWARIQAETVNIAGCALQHANGNPESLSKISYLPVQCLADDIFESFACPQVFADICSLRHNQSRCRDPAQSLLKQALELLTFSHNQIIQAHWYVRMSNALVYQKYLALRMEAQDEIRRNRNRRRRAKRSGIPESTGNRPQAKDLAYEKMLRLWIGPTETLRDHYKQALQDIVRSAEKVSSFFNSIGSGIQSPFWVLVPHDNFEKLAAVIHEDRSRFRVYLESRRPRLMRNYENICEGLRIVLGTQPGRLLIDDLQPSLLLEQDMDSDILLRSLIRVDKWSTPA